MENRIVLHVDFDYFYAQCEEIRNPELKGKPLAVCIFSDRGGDSGAIATANYIARKYGVKSGIPITFAKSKLKNKTDATFLPADFDYYLDMSSSAMSILKSFADIFEYVGKDEAYLDVAGKSDNSFSKASHIAQQLKNEIRQKLKMTCSIGVSPNKLISKIASDFKKPDGLTMVKPEQISEFLASLEIRKIPGIGKKTEVVFKKLDYKTIDELKKINIFELNKRFGRKTATYIYNAARGIDTNPVKPHLPTIQFSKIITLKENSKELDFLMDNLNVLIRHVYEIVMKNGKLFRSIGLQFVNEDLTVRTKSKTLRNPTNSMVELEKTAKFLLSEILVGQELLVRRIGLKVSELADIDGQSDITSYF